jgi:hypothetical protein
MFVATVHLIHERYDHLRSLLHLKALIRYLCFVVLAAALAAALAAGSTPLRE